MSSGAIRLAPAAHGSDELTPPPRLHTDTHVFFFFLFFFFFFFFQGLPGKVETGPETLTGHVPKYVNNALSHCFVFTLLFYALSDMSPISGFDGLYSFGCFFDIFPAMMTSLSLFGFALCFFLYYKGLNFPSTEDCGSSVSFLKVHEERCRPPQLCHDGALFFSSPFSRFTIALNLFWALAVGFFTRTSHGGLNSTLASSELTSSALSTGEPRCFFLHLLKLAPVPTHTRG